MTDFLAEIEGPHAPTKARRWPGASPLKAGHVTPDDTFVRFPHLCPGPDCAILAYIQRTTARRKYAAILEK